MLNQFAKFMLVSTSLSPVLGAVAVQQIASGKPWTDWAPWVIVGVLLIVVCWLVLTYSAKNLQVEILTIKQFEQNDKEVLAFLLAYLLPFISSKDVAFADQWMIGTYVIAIIFIVIAHSGAFHFNPVMGLLGYHFYGIKNEHGISQLLISKAELYRPDTEVSTVRLAHNIYLHRGEKGV